MAVGSVHGSLNHKHQHFQTSQLHPSSPQTTTLPCHSHLHLLLHRNPDWYGGQCCGGVGGDVEASSAQHHQLLPGQPRHCRPPLRSPAAHQPSR